MTTQPTPLPPSVAELRDIIAAHYRGDALNQLCALASRADPAPVADEAAIEAWERDWDAATRTLHFRIQRDEFDGVRAMGARAVRLMRAAPRNDDKLRQALVDWTHRYGSELVPPSGRSDTYGEGMRDAKDWVRKILAESPAGDAGESEARGLLKEAMGAFEPWVRGPGVVGGILHLQEEVGNLRARLQAAEAERAAAQKERDEERRKAAEHELNWRSVSDKLVDSWAERDKLQDDLADAKADRSIRDAEADGRRIQDLTTQIAAAQKERDEAVACAVKNFDECQELRVYMANGHVARERAEAELAAAKAEGAKAAVEALHRVGKRISQDMVTSEKCDPSGSYCTHCSGHEHLCPNGDGRLRYPAECAEELAAKPEAAQEPVWSEPNDHTKNVCAIRRRSDGYWWQCDSEHGAGWNDKRIRQAWTAREARLEVERHLQGQDVEIVQLMPEPKPEAAAATDAEREGDAVLSRWLALDKSLTQLEWLALMSVVVDELCRRALRGGR